MRKHQPDALNEAFAKPSKQDALAVSSGAAAREKSQHQLQHDGKRWTCQVCGRHASSGKQRSILAKTSCYFHLPLVKAHSSHVLWQAGRLCFCANCGGFGGRVLRMLREPCKARASASRRAVINKMMAGQHPRTKERLCSEARAMRAGWSGNMLPDPIG